MKEYLSSSDAVLHEQGTDAEAGLSASEAASRQAKFGPNKLKEEEKTPLWIRFFEQMADPMVIMLIVAAVISAVTGVIQGEIDFADVIIIMTVVIINSALGVIQEAKSEEALAALQEMSAAQSKVMRDGKLVMLHSSELVPGDVVLLEAGDSVPADCRVLESASMKIEEAALTGESVPVEKHAEAIELAAGADILTPNLTEAAIILGEPIGEDWGGTDISDEEAHRIVAALVAKGAKHVVLKGIQREGETVIRNFVGGIDCETHELANEYLPYMLHGTGDVYASCLLAAVMAGRSLEESVRFAGNFTHDAMIVSAKQPGYEQRGVSFEPLLGQVTSLL